tara:strand:+ start:442 stop:714 length:273 start_codon:yes stop_codon:yes gene_type:complete
MGTAIIKMKIMPTSPEVDLKAIEEKAKGIISKDTPSQIQSEEEPIAFGLTAVILTFTWDEDKELDSLEEALRAIENVNSAEIIDMRRAFG